MLVIQVPNDPRVYGGAILFYQRSNKPSTRGLPLVRNRRRPTTASTRIRCCASTRLWARRKLHCRTRSWRGYFRARSPAWWRLVRSEHRSTCGLDGPSSAYSSPRRCCSCNRTPESGDGLTGSVYLTWYTEKTHTHTHPHTRF